MRSFGRGHAWAPFESCDHGYHMDGRGSPLRMDALFPAWSKLFSRLSRNARLGYQASLEGHHAALIGVETARSTFQDWWEPLCDRWAASSGDS